MMRPNSSSWSIHPNPLEKREISNPNFQITNKFQALITNDQNYFVWDFEFWSHWNLVSLLPFEKWISKAKEIKRITIKSPSFPLFQRGKLTSPPFGVFLLPEAGKGRQGGIFKALKCYGIWCLGFGAWDLVLGIWCLELSVSPVPGDASKRGFPFQLA